LKKQFQSDRNLIAILFSVLILQFKGKTAFRAGLLVQMIPHTTTPVSILKLTTVMWSIITENLIIKSIRQ